MNKDNTIKDKILDSFETELEFDDKETYGSTIVGIKGIVMERYHRCFVEGSKEMVLGGVKTVVINGEVVEKVVPNQIEIFINSVQMFKVSLEPSIEKYKGYIKDKLSSANVNIIALDKLYNQKLEEIGSKSKSKNANWIKQYGKQYNERIVKLEEKYQDRRVVAYRDLLVVLSFLLKKENYFEEKRG